jgi:hypothetical protein
VQGVVAVSEDGSYVYFVAKGERGLGSSLLCLWVTGDRDAVASS